LQYTNKFASINVKPETDIPTAYPMKMFYFLSTVNGEVVAWGEFISLLQTYQQ
jgi:hypothetical protein